jgi:3-isopropylmalate dehydrogenase
MTDANLLGAMGLPDVRKPDGTEIAPQIDIREHYKLSASLRPAKLFKGVPSPLSTGSVDKLVIRETTEGLFAGRHVKLEPSDSSVSDRITKRAAQAPRFSHGVSGWYLLHKNLTNIANQR